MSHILEVWRLGASITGHSNAREAYDNSAPSLLAAPYTRYLRIRESLVLGVFFIYPSYRQPYTLTSTYLHTLPTPSQQLDSIVAYRAWLLSIDRLLSRSLLVYFIISSSVNGDEFFLTLTSACARFPIRGTGTLCRETAFPRNTHKRCRSKALSIQRTVMNLGNQVWKRGKTSARCLLASRNIWEGQDHVNLPSPLRRPTASETVYLLDEFDTN